MIGQSVDFEVLRVNETLHDRQTVAMIQRVHRLKSVPQLGHDHVAFALEGGKMPDRAWIQKRHVACDSKHPLCPSLFQPGIESAKTAAVGNHVPQDRRIGCHERTILRDDNRHPSKIVRSTDRLRT